MTGMGGSKGNDPVVVHAFHQALLHQAFVVAGLLVAVFVAWNVLRARQLGQAGLGADPPGPGRPAPGPEAQGSEAPARRLLRVGFGLLWVFDGVLQGQAAMPQHLVPDVIEPAAAGSPSWMADLVDNVTHIWTQHPVTAASATVWIQIGLGLWLLVGPRGRWSQAAGGASAVWGLLIWIFGEALGGILAPGLSWLEGAPGAALLYVIAGALVAIADNYWSRPRPIVLRAVGVTLAGSAVLQAWPGRNAGDHLRQMTHDMAATPQPGWLHAIARAVADHSGPANLVAIIALLAIGLALCATRPHRPGPTGAAAGAAIVLCLAAWVAVQDLGFLGGVGTDPNSMIPWAVLIAGGVLAATRPSGPKTGAPAPPWRTSMADPAYALRTVASAAAVAVTLVGAVPMAGATLFTAVAAPGAKPAVAVRSIPGCLRCTTSPGASTAR